MASAERLSALKKTNDLNDGLELIFPGVETSDEKTASILIAGDSIVDAMVNAAAETNGKTPDSVRASLAEGHVVMVAINT